MTSTKYLELEAKFDAEHLTVGFIQEFVDSDLMKEWRTTLFRRATGIDRFYHLPGKILRARTDKVLWEYPVNPIASDSPKVCLTVKQRCSVDDLLCRREVDLHIGTQDEADVGEFFELVGPKFEFAIVKEYHIWMLKRANVEVCLALYDVSWADSKQPQRRFLEIEIEKSSRLSLEVAQEELSMWIEVLEDELEVSKPMNLSLYELYRNGPPGT